MRGGFHFFHSTNPTQDAIGIELVLFGLLLLLLLMLARRLVITFFKFIIVGMTRREMNPSLTIFTLFQIDTQFIAFKTSLLLGGDTIGTIPRIIILFEGLFARSRRNTVTMIDMRTTITTHHITHTSTSLTVKGIPIMPQGKFFHW